MNRMFKVTKLHLNKLGSYAITPPLILAIVMAVSIIVQIAIQRAGGMDVHSAEYVQNARQNAAVFWSLPGFLVYYGVQAVATTYPFGLALGATRRNFVLGTVVANAVQSLYVALLLLVLLGVELVTNHWFLSVYVLDTNVLGNGNALTLVATAFIGTMFFLTVGGLFGAIWVRFGPKGPAILGLALGLALALLLLAIAPRLGEIIAGVTAARIALAAFVIMAIALAATWLSMRRASVR